MIKGLDKEKYEVFDITPIGYSRRIVKIRDKRTRFTSKCDDHRSALQNAQQALKHVKAQNYHYGLRNIFQFIEGWTLYQKVIGHLEGEQVMEMYK